MTSLKTGCEPGLHNGDALHRRTLHACTSHVCVCSATLLPLGPSVLAVVSADNVGHGPTRVHSARRDNQH
jgi:hypothetical protein